MDIHSPSLPQRTPSTTAQSLNELLQEKVILEGTLTRLNAVLESHGVGNLQLAPHGLTGRYVDPIN